VTKRSQPEHDEQVKFFEEFREHYPTIVGFAIPNGGKRNILVALKLKEEGVLSGVPDIFIADGKPGLFIEIKIHPNKPSENQIKVMTALKDVGYSVVVAYSCAEAMQSVEFYLNSKKN
jgi:hypothetical protein